MVGEPIRILLLEDSESDAELIQSGLASGGLSCDWRREQSREGFLAGLRDFRPDLVLADYALPSYDGLSALKEARQAQPGVPFIFVTGNMGEDLAVESLKSGATDFVTKNSLGRLVPAVRRALRELAEAAERRKAEAAIRASFEMQSHLDAMLRASLANIPLREKLARHLSILLSIPWLAAEPKAAVFLVKGTSLTMAAHQGLEPELAAACANVPMGRCLCGRAAESGKVVASTGVGPDHEIACEGMSPHGHYCAPIAAGGKSLGVLSLHLKEGAVLDAAQQDFVKAATDILAANIRHAQTENQLMQSQKMESVGRLAGGIAHDFNNILTAILGFSDFLLGSIPAGDPRREDVAEIKSGGERAAALTRQLLVFSRQQVLEPKVLDVNVLVGDFMKMLRRVIGEDVALEFRPDKGACLVNADGGQLEQVIMNLTVNARDAMPHGGRIIIATASVALGAEAGGVSPDLKPGPYAVLSVSDTGHGMDAEVMKRIFEPFFTTKESGKGTGLGLSTVYGIVRQSGGAVTVESAPGKGSTFKVWLPIVAQAAQPGPVKTRDAARPRGKETILVLDDDASIRKVIARALGRDGYRILEAATGLEALSLCARGRGIDLLLCDVILADGGRGTEAARRLRAASPEMRIIFMSGYTDERVSQVEMTALADAFLQKPISPETLARKVRAVLDAPRPAAA